MGVLTSALLQFIILVDCSKQEKRLKEKAARREASKRMKEVSLSTSLLSMKIELWLSALCCNCYSLCFLCKCSDYQCVLSYLSLYYLCCLPYFFLLVTGN